MRLPITEGNRRWWTLGAMCCALFMAMLDNTVVNVALPTIQHDLHSTISGLEWTINAYTLAFAVLLVTAGRLGDLFGRVRLFLFGVVLFATASGLIALAQDETWLVAWRAVQGIGGAFMMPATLSIISNAFPAEERGRAIGTWAGVSALALAVGPVIGGFLVEHVSWQSIFLVNLPVAAFTVLLTVTTARESRDEHAVRSVDLPGVAALTVGLAALVLALVQGNHWGWGSTRIVALFAIAVLALAGFALIERRVKVPMVDFRFFASKAFLGANLIGFLVTFAMFAVFFFLTLYMQNVKGYSPLETGVRFLPSTLLIVIISPLSGRLVDKIGARLPIAVGSLVLTASLVWMSFLDQGSAYWFILVPFLLMGVGMGLVMSPMTTAAMNAVDPRQAGGASGILSMNRMVGGTFGVALLGAVVTALGKHRLEELLPNATSTQVDRLADGLGSGAAPQGVGGRVADATTDAFVHALSGGLRLAAVFALSAALVALLTIRSGSHVPADAGEPHETTEPQQVEVSAA
jgi:EmrB/QacA subfamily drug resistance transporter